MDGPSRQTQEADYWRSGLIASTIANVNRPKGKTAFTVEDFMPTERKDKTQGELRADIDAAMSMFGGTDGGGKTTAEQRPKED